VNANLQPSYPAYLKTGRSHFKQGFDRPRPTSKWAWRPHLLVLTIRKFEDLC
jgi:hypothetical protein